MKINQSENLFQQSRELVPGGVHSPVRSFKGLPQTPIFFERADGAYLYSIDSIDSIDSQGKNTYNDYIDFCMSFGPMILGHKNPMVEEKLHEALKRGWSYGACEPYSLELAEFLVKKIPFIDQIRFMNSGTEAVMTALRLARGYTQRNKILKFNGCYHGHTDSMLIQSGSGLAGSALASSAGIPESSITETLVVDLGDLEGLYQSFKQWSHDIAAVIIEPLPANYGLLTQEESFLKEIKNLCELHGSLLIFDEVISGFRVHPQGMSGLLNITPDLITYGKIIGGGMPVGAVAGRKEIMQCLAPVGNVYQAGTLSANPVAMVAGLSTLKQLTDEFYQSLEITSKKIVEELNLFLQSRYKEENLQIISFQSLFWITSEASSRHGRIDSIKKIPSHQGQIFQKVFMDLLQRGIYLAPNAYEVGFISSAHQFAFKEFKKRLWE